MLKLLGRGKWRGFGDELRLNVSFWNEKRVCRLLQAFCATNVVTPPEHFGFILALQMCNQFEAPLQCGPLQCVCICTVAAL